MSTRDIINSYLETIKAGLVNDASAKGQKIPVSSMEIEVNDTEGKLWAAHYFKYLVVGRGPGKAPPPDAMEKFVRDNPDILEEARAVWRSINERSLAFLIGRKIAREGTDIFTGKKPGIDLQGMIDAATPDFLERVAYAQASATINRMFGEPVPT